MIFKNIHECIEFLETEMGMRVHHYQDKRLVLQCPFPLFQETIIVRFEDGVHLDALVYNIFEKVTNVGRKDGRNSIREQLHHLLEPEE